MADPEFDALFESAVAVTVGGLLSSNDVFEGASLVAPSANAAAVSLPTGNDTDCAGAPPRFTVTTADIVAEQRTHPALEQIIEFIATGGSALPAFQDDLKQLEKQAKTHFLSDEGLLVYNSGRAGAPDRVYLPPRFHQWCLYSYHDRQGHQGWKRTFSIIATMQIYNVCTAHVT